jgi:hypothetical protein
MGSITHSLKDAAAAAAAAATPDLPFLHPKKPVNQFQ